MQPSKVGLVIVQLHSNRMQPFKFNLLFRQGMFLSTPSIHRLPSIVTVHKSSFSPSPSHPC